MKISRYDLLAWANSRISYLQGFVDAGVNLPYTDCNTDNIQGQIMALNGLIEGIHRGNFDMVVD